MTTTAEPWIPVEDMAAHFRVACDSISGRRPVERICDEFRSDETEASG